MDLFENNWANTIIQVLNTEFPHGAAHYSTSHSDCDVSPRRLHPAFWGCLDWHSAVHMQWSAVTLLNLGVNNTELIELLDSRLSAENIAVEAEYLRSRPSFERPYGWAWALQLACACQQSNLPQALKWYTNLQPLVEVINHNLAVWLPKLKYPVRHGVHSNTAFSLFLAHQAYEVMQNPQMSDLVGRKALIWFTQDVNYPVQWELSGNDFLSPSLCEAVLMRRLLPQHAFKPWLQSFLPQLGERTDPLLQLPQITDDTDGHLVHLYGLQLSRAWMLRNLADLLDLESRKRVLHTCNTMAAQASRQITDGHFMSTHWLVSFALQARLAL